MIAIHLRNQIPEKKPNSDHKASFMINLKAKDHIMNAFLDLVEFEKLRKERWEKLGFYFKINKNVIPSFEVQIDQEENYKCITCEKILEKAEPHFFSFDTTNFKNI